MRLARPRMTEQEAELQQRLQRDQDSHNKLRLQTFSRLAIGQAHDRQEVARRLGVHRHTISCGLTLYAARGLAAWLEPDVPAGKPVSLAPNVLASLEQALRHPKKAAPPMRR